MRISDEMTKKLLCMFLKEKKMDVIKNDFNYLFKDSLLAPRMISYYGVDGEGIFDAINNCREDSSMDDLISIVETHIESDDLRNAIMSFYYSFKCEFGEKVAYSTYAVEKYSESGNDNGESAKAIVGKNAGVLKKDKSELYNYMGNLLPKGKKVPGGTVPFYDADVLVQSLYSYPKNPYKFFAKHTTVEDKGYNQTEFAEFMGYFDNVLNTGVKNKTANDKELTADDKIKIQINSYIFERLYNVRFISTIISIYEEMNCFFESLQYNGIGIVSADREYEYIDYVQLIDKINSSFKKECWDISLAKEILKNSLKNYVLDLCEFSIIPDIYTREDNLKDYVRTYADKLVGLEPCRDHIRNKVAECTRKAYIKNEVLYYSYLLWKVKKIQCANEEKDVTCRNDIWTNMFDKAYAKKHIEEDLSELKLRVISDEYDKDFSNLSIDFSVYDGLVERIFEKIYMSSEIYSVNEKVMRAPLASAYFASGYKKLIEQSLQAHVTFYDVYIKGQDDVVFYK